MGIVIHRGAAGVHGDVPRCMGDELFLLVTEGIVEQHKSASFPKHFFQDIIQAACRFVKTVVP